MLVFNPLTSSFETLPPHLVANYLSIGGARDITTTYAGLPSRAVFTSDGNTDWQTAYVDSTTGPDYAAALAVFPDAKSGGGFVGVTSFFGGYQGELSFGFYPSDSADDKANSMAVFTSAGGALLSFNDGVTDLGRAAYRWKNGYFSGTVKLRAIEMVDGNLVLGTTTGTKIGTATSQKLGFWNATPVVQPTTAVVAATRVAGGGASVLVDDTYDGYTLAQIVKALRNAGLLA